jgi:hypothetical protein
MDLRSQTICVDFDGVIRDKVTNKPIEGSDEGIRFLRREHEVIIFTARTDTEFVSMWLEDNGFPKMKITNKKPVASVYLDDHAIRFEGSWEYALREVSIHPTGWQD